MTSIISIDYKRKLRKEIKNEEKIIVRHSTGDKVSATLLNALPRTQYNMAHSAYYSYFDFYWTNEKVGRLLPSDYDGTNDSLAPDEYNLCPCIEKLGEISGYALLGGNCNTEEERNCLRRVMLDRNDEVAEVYKQIDQPVCNMYLINNMKFKNTPHSTMLLRQRILTELPYELHRHDHIMPELLVYCRTHESSEEKRNLLESCGFIALQGVYIKEQM